MKPRIGIELNGVLRDTLTKIEQTYNKFYVEDPLNITELKKYEVLSQVTTLDLKKHLKFENDDAVYSFLYEEFPMEIFGHSPSVEMTTFNDFNEFYIEHRDNFDISIVSDEIGKSKPASLFFISKFGCLVEKVKFYSNSTINSMWDEIDILLTANPDLLLTYPKDKTVIKFITEYNKETETHYSISKLKELGDIIKTITND
jgi:hypothetical protein